MALRYGFIDKSIVVVTDGPGPQKFHGRGVTLVNQHNASAAEMVDAFAQENRLATVVHRRRPAGYSVAVPANVGKGYGLGLLVASYLTWQGAQPENEAVQPDKTVDLRCGALKEGRDAQFERALEISQIL